MQDINKALIQAAYTLASFRYPRLAHLSKSPSKLLRLPQELLSMMFDTLDILDDAVRLCMVDGRLFRAGFPRLVQLQKQSYANWAGHRIICMGECTSNDDFPESMEQTVKSEVQMWSREDSTECESFIDIVETHYTNFKPGMVSSRRQGEKIEKDEKDALSALLAPRYDSNDQPWVFCNLSKGKYVRADAVAALTESDGSTPFIPGLGSITLDHVALSRICWSSSDWIAMESVDNLHRGIWAGDRFEVTTLDKLDKKIEWEDVSDEMVQFLDKVWQIDQGEDWKETVKQNRRYPRWSRFGF
jgi:hypothetical protein